MTTITFNKEIFQAAWPKSLEPTASKKVANFVWNALCATVLLPIGVARVLNHWIIRPIIIENFIETGIKRHKGHKFENKPISFKMANGQTIKGTFLQGVSHGNKLIILSCGSGQWCEKTGRHPALLESGASILAINNPGVGTSKSYPGIDGLDIHKSFGLATFSAFELATQTKLNGGKRKFHEKNILFYGYSLGGAAATIGAGYVEETYGEKAKTTDGKEIKPVEVKLINDRSFNNLNKLAIARILQIKNTPFQALKFAKKISKCITFFIPNFLIRISVYSTTFLAGLRLDPETAFKKLKTEKKCIIFSKKDPIIPYKGGSLFKSIKDSKKICTGIKLDDGYDHLKTFEGEAKNTTLKCIQDFLGLSKTKSSNLNMADT
ncbi:MAG: hypothetical protein V4494_01235 [Chlamydiota bacterium]